MEEHTGNPFWKIYYVGSDQPKITPFLSEAQEFARTHEVKSISFYVGVMFKAPGINTEKDFGERGMTKEELESLTQTWVEDAMSEIGVESYKYFTGQT